MNIENILKEYKEKKAFVEMTLARIEQYKLAIANPDTWLKEYVYPSHDLFAPKGSRTVKSPVESCLIQRDLTIEDIKNWIAEDESRVGPKKVEVEQIEKAFISLSKQEKCIIELKYFEGLFWKDIELNFNEKHRQKNYITVAGIRKINNEALNKLTKVLKPFYERFGKIA